MQRFQEVANNIPLHVVSASAAGGAVYWLDQLNVYVKIGSAIYLTLLIATVGFNLYKNIRKDMNGH